MGVEPNPKTMVDYLQKAYSVDSSEAEVCFKLGYAYYDGNGIERNLKKAKELMEKALSLGYNCTYRLNIIKKELGEEDADSNPMHSYAEEFTKKKIPFNKLYKKIESDLKKDFGSTWEKLDENTKIFLSTAMLSFVSLYSTGTHARGYIDFSSAISPMFKALECELGKYLFSGYMKYLRDNSINPFDFGEGKRFFINWDAKRYLSPDDLDEFTLGSIRALMGLGKKTSFSSMAKGYGEKEKITLSYESSMDKPMFEYLKTIVKEESFSLYGNRELAEYFISLTEIIDDMTKNTRNKAAHKNVMSYIRAEECGNQIIKSQKILKTFVDMFK